jgi:adenine-specific DNA glycosylase
MKNKSAKLAPKIKSAIASTPQKELLAWYKKNGRTLPWRTTRDPYRILVSEVMLQQTQVERVLPFYQRFMVLFPNEAALAAANDDAIHRAWKGFTRCVPRNNASRRTMAGHRRGITRTPRHRALYCWCGSVFCIWPRGAGG